MNTNNLKFLSSNWVITLSATLIGVFLALYLNEWMASKKLSNQKSIATKNILSEISSNQKRLEKSIIEHDELFETIKFLIAYEEEGKLIVPKDSMNNFRKKYPEVVMVEDSILISKGIYRYKGELNTNFSQPHIELTTIAWKTLKNSGFSTSYEFECLMYLESIDKWTIEILEKDKMLLEYLNGERNTGTKDEKLVKHLEFLIGYEKSLLRMYKQREEELKSCG